MGGNVHRPDEKSQSALHSLGDGLLARGQDEHGIEMMAAFSGSYLDT